VERREWGRAEAAAERVADVSRPAADRGDVRTDAMMTPGLRVFVCLGLGVVGVAALLATQAPPRDEHRRQREAFARGFNLAGEHPRLAGYLRLLSAVLGGPEAFRQPTVSAIPTSSSNREVVLSAAADLVALRFRVAPGGVTARFANIARPHAGRILIRGGSAVVEVSDRHRDHDDRILAIVAHEFAHEAIDRALAGTPGAGRADDESLVDAAAVMVGLGPIMLRASYDEESPGTADSARWGIVRIGELDPVAIAYLTLVQAELAGVDDETRQLYVARWLEPAWSFRRAQWERLRPRRDSAGMPVIECPTCLSQARLLPDGVTYACPVCGQHARFSPRDP
jgi:hypothetical protein